MDTMLSLLRRALAVQALLTFAVGCATLGSLGIVRPLHFDTDDQRPAELRLFGFGGAGVRLWARVENPNGFGLTLSTVRGTLFLEDTEAAAVDLPLGLPLEANQETVVPIDISVRLDRLPRLAGVLGRVVTGSAVDYRLQGTFGVDAGALGTPTFGPMTLLRGEARVLN